MFDEEELRKIERERERERERRKGLDYRYA